MSQPGKKQAEYLERIISFSLYWDGTLSVRLKNSELLSNYQNKNDCENDILCELLNWYTNSTISLALLELYEVAHMANKVDPAFVYDENDIKDPLGLVISYRNKLVTHRETTKGTPDGDRVRNIVKKTQGNIYRDIEAAVGRILEWIDTQEHNGGAHSGPTTVAISTETLSNLVKSVPVFRYKPFEQ